jgi:tetratricopeptide (TPR) repeat protein
MECAYFLTGRVTPIGGDSVEVVLILNDTRSDDPIANESEPGLAADTWRHGLRAVNKLLPTIIPGATRDVEAEWRRRPPRAIASFLLGESDFRRVRHAEALEHYSAAVDADSTFALAAIRGAQAATWSHDPVEAASLVRIALRQQLEPRYAHFARGYTAFLEGRADSAAAEFRRVVTVEPAMSSAWMQLGEVYVHLLPMAGNTDSLALAALETAHRIDPTATVLQFHLIEIYLRGGDITRAAPLAEQFIAGSGSNELAAKVSIMLECVRDGASSIGWDSIAARQPLPLLMASSSLAAGMAQPACAEAGFAALLRVDTAATPEADGRRWSAVMGLHATLLARGDTAATVAMLDSVAERWGYGRSLFLFGAPFVHAFVDRAHAMALSDAELYGHDYRGVRFNTRLWELGLVEAVRGRTDVADAVARELEHRASEAGSARDTRMATSVRAHAALARGDTARAVLLLESLLAAPVTMAIIDWDEAEPYGLERLTLARILTARGQHRRAIEIANVIDSSAPIIYAAFVPASLVVRADAADAMHDSELATRFRDRLAALQRSAQAVQ